MILKTKNQLKVVNLTLFLSEVLHEKAIFNIFMDFGLKRYFGQWQKVYGNFVSGKIFKKNGFLHYFATPENLGSETLQPIREMDEIIGPVHKV